MAATILAAFIQKTWRLRRPRLPKCEQMEYDSIHESDSFSAVDVVKVLDLHDSGKAPNGEPGTAVLSDSYLICRESSDGNGVVFRYATSGALKGECVSHAENQVTGSYESAHFAARLAIAVPLEHVAENSSVRVTNRVVFTGAFDRLDTEDFETHIERAIRSLTIILLFPRSRPCTSVSGEAQATERGKTEIARNNGPLIADDGAIVYWRIFPKKGDWLPVGARYRLRWSRSTLKSPGNSLNSSGQYNSVGR